MENESTIEIVHKKTINTENSKIILGFPEVGLVGTIASMFLVETLKMEEVGYLRSSLFPPLIILHKGKPAFPVRIYSYNNTFLILSEIPIPPAAIFPLSSKIVNWAKENKADILLMIGGLPVPNRMDIEKPDVFTAVCGEKAERVVEQLGIKKLEEGMMVGPYAAMFMECYNKNVNAVLLSAQAFARYPDPGAAASVVTVLSRILGVDIDIKPLLERAEELRIRLRDLMRTTSQTMARMGKSQEHGIPPMMYV
jgi:uncharacterized protein